MKNLIFYFKPVAIVLLFPMLMQSCVVYYKQGNTIDGAVDAETKVKCVLYNNMVFYYDKIIKEKNEIIGISKRHGITYKISIPVNEVKEIHLMNKKASKKATYLLVAGLFIGYCGITILLMDNMHLDMSF